MTGLTCTRPTDVFFAGVFFAADFFAAFFATDFFETFLALALAGLI